MENAFIDTSKLPEIERLPGWRGRYSYSRMMFAHYEFDAASSVHKHSIRRKRFGKSSKVRWKSRSTASPSVRGPGFAGIVPPNTLHALKAISSGKAIVVDYPLRELPTKPHERSELTRAALSILSCDRNGSGPSTAAQPQGAAPGQNRDHKGADQHQHRTATVRERTSTNTEPRP